jgi:hypothetical protein
MFGAFSFGNAEFASIPSTEQTENQEEVIVFSPGVIEEGDNGSYF